VPLDLHNKGEDMGAIFQRYLSHFGITLAWCHSSARINVLDKNRLIATYPVSGGVREAAAVMREIEENMHNDCIAMGVGV
jgi:hypothetical protein